MEWAKDHWHTVQSVTDWVSALWAKAKSKPGKEKSSICVVLGAALSATVQERPLPGDSSNQVPLSASAGSTGPYCGPAGEAGGQKGAQ